MKSPGIDSPRFLELTLELSDPLSHAIALGPKINVVRFDGPDLTLQRLNLPLQGFDRSGIVRWDVRSDRLCGHLIARSDMRSGIRVAH
jgi:hypothetical protein